MRAPWASASSASPPFARLTGKVDPAAAVWRFKKNLPFIPTPVAYDGLVYMVKAGGIITAVDPATGLAVKEGRSKDAPGDYTASPIAADGKVFLASVNGKVTVLKAGREWEVLGVNDLVPGKKPDLVLSGVNRGANLAEDVTMSGTVAGPVKPLLTAR